MPPGGATLPHEPPQALIFRLPVHQVWLPPEAGPQDGTPRLLRRPHKTQSHPPSLQPTGVLPASVSARGCPAPPPLARDPERQEKADPQGSWRGRCGV